MSEPHPSTEEAADEAADPRGGPHLAEPPPPPPPPGARRDPREGAIDTEGTVNGRGRNDAGRTPDEPAARAEPTQPLEPTQVIERPVTVDAGPGPAGRGGRAGHSRAEVAAGVLRAVRPRQWVKNVLVFAAPGAAGVLFHGRPLLHTLAAFALFCAVSSGTYLLNDSLDVDADRAHPVKRHRPIAAGIVSVRLGLVLAGACMGLGILLGALLRPQFGLVLGIYVVLQLAYSSYLKHLPIYDMTCVAGGFLLRAIAGAVAIPVAVSEWFLIVTTFGSLLMVTGKRLAEHAELGEERGGHRATLDAYSISFLRVVVAMSATGATVGYALWAFGLEAAAVAVHHHDGIFFQLSIIPVLLALLHFTLLIEQGHGARPEELVLGDRQLQLLGVMWAVLFALGVYG